MPAFRLSDSQEHYIATHPNGREQTLDRVTHVLQGVGLSPRYGRGARPAADLGHQLHELIKDFLKTGEQPNPEPGPLLNAWQLFWEYWSAQNLAPVDVERCIGHCGLGYGGMLDFRGFDKQTGELEITDWKTSKWETCRKSWKAYQLQLAAYGLALEELKLGFPSRATIVRIGKEDDAPEVLPVWSTVEEGVRLAWEWREALRRYRKAVA